ncbi:HD-GYP domain-containing protein [Azonexus sp. IMCC34839]|uniref:HD-GYP domain-containing protein n=1 Tax=Azonexus sp. IMCC34839 TaxID=3133695 RepID=UPI0039994A41
MSSFVFIDQLRVGLYVELDLPWMKHPFSFSSFKIKSDEQIRQLRQLGLDKVRYDPRRSSTLPLPLQESGDAAPLPPPLPPDDPLLLAKQARGAHLANYRTSVAQAEQALHQAVQEVRRIIGRCTTDPQSALDDATRLVDDIAGDYFGHPDALIHAMGDKGHQDSLYHHGLNVTVLSLIMARGLDLPTEQIRTLGLGALFHDIGLHAIPSTLLRKVDPLTAGEVKLRQTHCEQGVELGRKLGFPQGVLDIIAQHHELMDGSGYPQQLRGEQITLLARLVEVANRYDSLCNPTTPSKAKTPHEALSYMFAQQASKHDPQMMRQLIRSLGVYPPGTLVHLSNGATALVTSVNPTRPLKPVLIVYETSVPRDEAIIIDLDQEPDVQIAHALNPNQLPRSIYDYLCMRKHVSYYFGEGSPGNA